MQESVGDLERVEEGVKDLEREEGGTIVVGGDLWEREEEEEGGGTEEVVGDLERVWWVMEVERISRGSAIGMMGVEVSTDLEGTRGGGEEGRVGGRGV